jgi:hypothetical protein
MEREIDKGLRALLDLRERVRTKLTPEDMEALQRRLIIGPVENPPVYSAFRCFEGSGRLESLLKKSKLNKLERHDLLFYLTVVQALVCVFEGASCHWTSGMELLELCGGKLAGWMHHYQWPDLETAS